MGVIYLLYDQENDRQRLLSDLLKEQSEEVLIQMKQKEGTASRHSKIARKQGLLLQLQKVIEKMENVQNEEFRTLIDDYQSQSLAHHKETQEINFFPQMDSSKENTLKLFLFFSILGLMVVVFFFLYFTRNEKPKIK